MAATVGRLDHEFADEALLRQALTHRSSGRNNNERLEFLGDAVLGFVTAELLYQRFPTATEGELTRMRAALVRRETLAEIARELDLGPSLVLGEGELKSGGRNRKSILADCLEALLGAVYLDAGMAATRALIAELLGKRLDAMDPRDAAKDAKTRLQEHLQARQLPLPDYAVTDIEGEGHDQSFHVLCELKELGLATRGSAGSRRKAEQVAAARALAELGDP
ncbi:MAG: ribonuclease III [Gammaproteobacteria bacterium]|nr:ribonuclease III [Gammaproteobacteria bacterium]